MRRGLLATSGGCQRGLVELERDLVLSLKNQKAGVGVSGGNSANNDGFGVREIAERRHEISVHGVSGDPFALAMEGERGEWARRLAEEHAKMLKGMKERVDEWGKRGRRSDGIKTGAESIQAQAKSAQQTVERFQRERPAHLFRTRFDGSSGLLKECQKKGGQQGSGNRVLGKRVGQEDGAGPTAAPAQPAIGAKNPLPPQALGTGIGGGVSPDQGMAVERISTTAMGAGEGFKSKKS